VHYSWEKPNIRLTKDFGDGGKETLTSNQPLQVMPTLLNYKEGEEKVTLQFEKEN
jgi:hypothetical protein